MKVCAAILMSMLVLGCANTEQYVKDPETQVMVAQLLVARVIEKSDHPQVVAQKILLVTDSITTATPPTLVMDELKTRLNYSTMQVSEQIALDGLLEAMNKDITAAAAPGLQGEQLLRWVGIIRGVAVRFIPVEGAK